MRNKLTILKDANGKRIDGQYVHLRQGDVDGACGPYCIFMALIAAGIEPRERITSFGEYHGNTNFGKLMSKFDNRSGRFFANGTILKDLSKFLSAYPSVKTGMESGNATIIRNFLVTHIRQNHPVILGLPGHWVLATGIYESAVGELISILALDPGRDSARRAWNVEIEAFGTGSPLPFLVRTDGSRVAFDDAFALWI